MTRSLPGSDGEEGHGHKTEEGEKACVVGRTHEVLAFLFFLCHHQTVQWPLSFSLFCKSALRMGPHIIITFTSPWAVQSMILSSSFILDGSCHLLTSVVSEQECVCVCVYVCVAGWLRAGRASWDLGNHTARKPLTLLKHKAWSCAPSFKCWPDTYWVSILVQACASFPKMSSHQLCEISSFPLCG